VVSHNSEYSTPHAVWRRISILSILRCPEYHRRRWLIYCFLQTRFTVQTISKVCGSSWGWLLGRPPSHISLVIRNVYAPTPQKDCHCSKIIKICDSVGQAVTVRGVLQTARNVDAVLRYWVNKSLWRKLTETNDKGGQSLATATWDGTKNNGDKTVS
jgi:hypothetical protein